MAGMLVGLAPHHKLEMKPNHLLETPFQGSEPICTTRQCIDEDIDKLQAKIRELRKKRNELSSISVLPPEILSKIFIFFRDMCYDASYHNRSAQIQWIRVGHICHYWREVALSCPTLWSAPIFTNPELVQEMMRRSKMAALTIRAQMATWTPRLMDQLENAVAQMPRIQNLQLTLGGHPDRLTNLLSAFSGPAPLLERISLSNTTYVTHGSQPIVPDNAFKEAPRLRSIELNRLNIGWESPMFTHKSLTTLRLRHLNRAEGVSTTISQLMDALANIPRLRVLEIVNSLPPYIACGSDSRVLQFDLLEQLSIESKTSDCAALLQRVQYPPRTKIKLHCTTTREEVLECSTILSIVGRALRRTSHDGPDHLPVVLRAAELGLSYSGGAEILVYDKPRQLRRIWAPVSRLDSIVNVYFEGDLIFSRCHESIFRDMCTSFDLSQLRALILNWRLDNSLMIQECLGKLAKLESIQVTDRFPQLCFAIKENLEGRTAAPDDEQQEGKTRYALRKKKAPFSFPPVTVFPALKTLVIEGGEFGRRKAPGQLEVLIDTLMQRCDMNSPIERLILDDCPGLRDPQLKRLAEIVADVDVEGESIDIAELAGDDYSEDEDTESYSDEDEFLGYDDDPYFDIDYDLDELSWLPHF